MNVNTTLPAAAQQPLVAEHTLSAMHAATSMDAKTAIITTAKPGSSGQVAMAPALKERPVTKKITNRTATIATRDILQPIHPAATMEAEKPMLVKNDVDVYHSAAEQDLLQAEKDRYRAALDRQQAERDRAQAALDRKQAEKDRIQAEKDRMQAEKDRMQADKDRAQADLDRIQADKDRAQTMLDAGLAANTHGAIKK
ncbi:MAG: hypothetical protein EOO03_08955 [Chitinophagaceae bacterium]|nr:MAG: hypothetical protein EOO03_08955 [Chitinophagaceae bacterium]